MCVLLMPKTPERQIFETYAGSVAFVAVETPEGDQSIGTCFHVGDNLFVTAKHVVESNKILRVANTPAGIQTQGEDGLEMNYLLGSTEKVDKIYYHPDEKYDVCALRLPDITCPLVPLGNILDDPFGSDFIFTPVVIMGFPHVYASNVPVLVCARGEVNASFISYLHQHRMYVISCLARGGFSGGPVLMSPGKCLGIVTNSLLKSDMPAELGFMAVIESGVIYELLSKNDVMPDHLKGEWARYRNRVIERMEREEMDEMWRKLIAPNDKAAN